MAEFMYRIMLGFKTCQIEIFVNEPLYRFDADPLLSSTQKEGRGIGFDMSLAQSLIHIVAKGILTCFVEINDALFVSFSRDGQRTELSVDVVEVDPNELGKTHSAVEKECDDGEIAHSGFGVGVVFDAIQKREAFFQGKIFGESLLFFRRFDVCRGIVLEHHTLDGQIFKESLDGRELS